MPSDGTYASYTSVYERISIDVSVWSALHSFPRPGWRERWLCERVDRMNC